MIGQNLKQEVKLAMIPVLCNTVRQEKESSIENQIMKIQQIQIIIKISHRFSHATKSFLVEK